MYRLLAAFVLMLAPVCDVFADTCKVDIQRLARLNKSAKWTVNQSVSASFTSYNNWLSENRNTVILLYNADLRHRKNYVSGWSHHHLYKNELGYIYYSDSLWKKNADNFKLTLQWFEKPGKHLTHSYSFYIRSQFLKSYKYTFRNDSLIAELNGWMMAPGTVEMAYGFNWTFFDDSNLNIAFATCRFDAKPVYGIKPDGEEKLFSIGKTVVAGEYGFSAQLYVKQDFFGKLLTWDHQGRYFYKALTKSGVHADVSNRITLRFLKFMQLRLDSQFIYDPDVSRKGSYKNELLLGLFYEYRN